MIYNRITALHLLSFTVLQGKVAESFVNYNQQPLPCPSRSENLRASSTSCQMVRNIDMVEALIFYGTKCIFSSENQENGQRIFLPGVENLIEECVRDETSVIAILDNDNDIVQCKDNHSTDTIVFKTETSAAPNPKDLWEAIHSIKIQPKGFGGSSGFGRKAADPVRSPLPPRSVVLCDTIDKCRAARYAGMRVLCLTDNDLADGVMNFDSSSGENADLEYYWESINMDDIATPGSFWLNPPLPKDDEGNGVNVLSIIQSYERIDLETNPQQQAEDTTSNDDFDPDDGELEAILMDMDPLK